MDCFYEEIKKKALSQKTLDQNEALKILSGKDIQLLSLLDSAFAVRNHYRGKKITIHILNNAQNGYCPEDCHYCAQSKFSKTKINKYPLKKDEQILEEAKQAYQSGAFRYCIVTAGQAPSPKRIEKLASLITKIKKHYPLELCLSLGLIDDKGAKKLKEAGLDRINHNLNTSKNFYPKICTTHSYDDRLRTLKSATKVHLDICSGIIVGMGESHQDIFDVALQLRELKAPSIPVNFLIPIEGTPLEQKASLNPQFCLRVLCLFRLLNPQSEIRISAGREGHLRSLEAFALYPCDSLFLEGYLNTKGGSSKKTIQMIHDAGFEIISEIPIEKLLGKTLSPSNFAIDGSFDIMKKHHPAL